MHTDYGPHETDEFNTAHCDPIREALALLAEQFPDERVSLDTAILALVSAHTHRVYLELAELNEQ
ncbi:hypothetical protein P5W04_10325 [Mycobacteroides abscessus subsp. abscessus]|uniref:hypothetical protein n=1 Tax=Mycobacteroides abscessus TaxID=36809 RepID=UPI000E69FF46|nr:hypothetical protein [Mycobacteroides abscessus]MBN7484548.1 hypothetical protein [Mycobacteroides abscessus subsp. abscessus]MDO3240510.1 hypothetical protein [Mycobacteroides abscessus subsp. abscessus]RIT75005.1 hypothetical protein D2E77_01600 [Mycobacteroides abscessus]